MTEGTGSRDHPWQLQTPSGSSSYTMHRDEKDGTAVIVCAVGTTVLLYDARCADGRAAANDARRRH